MILKHTKFKQRRNVLSDIIKKNDVEIYLIKKSMCRKGLFDSCAEKDYLIHVLKRPV